MQFIGGPPLGGFGTTGFGAGLGACLGAGLGVCLGAGLGVCLDGVGLGVGLVALATINATPTINNTTKIPIIIGFIIYYMLFFLITFLHDVDVNNNTIAFILIIHVKLKEITSAVDFSTKWSVTSQPVVVEIAENSGPY